MGKEGCLALAHALPKNKALRELDVTCNRVDLLALSFLMKGVVGNKGLRTLKVSLSASLLFVALNNNNSVNPGPMEQLTALLKITDTHTNARNIIC